MTNYKVGQKVRVYGEQGIITFNGEEGEIVRVNTYFISVDFKSRFNEDFHNCSCLDTETGYYIFFDDVDRIEIVDNKEFTVKQNGKRYTFKPFKLIDLVKADFPKDLMIDLLNELDCDCWEVEFEWGMSNEIESRVVFMNNLEWLVGHGFCTVEVKETLLKPGMILESECGNYSCVVCPDFRKLWLTNPYKNFIGTYKNSDISKTLYTIFNHCQELFDKLVCYLTNSPYFILYLIRPVLPRYLSDTCVISIAISGYVLSIALSTLILGSIQ